MEFISKPNNDTRLGDYLLENFAGTWTHFRAAVAFVKRSGTRHIRKAMSDFAQSGKVEIIAGIDHKGSSAAGLIDLLDSAGTDGSVMIFHNRLPFTFHPKLYLFKSSRSAELLIGSSNLTEGGLFTNYEASIRLTLDLTKADHVAVLGAVESVLDHWSDTSRQTVRLLNRNLLKRFVALGRVPSSDHDMPQTEDPTANLTPPSQSSDSSEDAGRQPAPDPFRSLFAAEGVPPAPTPPRSKFPDSGTAVAPRHANEEQASTTETGRRATTVFVMTLHRTDVGVGQTTSGATRRSPEIFVPLAARNANPEFWDWPAGFVEDPGKPGKIDRDGVRMRIGGEIVAVNMMTWPDKHDFRLRSETLRSAGNIGDVLRLEKVGSNVDFDYYAEIVPQETTEHPRYLALCTEPVRNSERRYGYY